MQQGLNLSLQCVQPGHAFPLWQKQAWREAQSPSLLVTPHRVVSFSHFVSLLHRCLLRFQVRICSDPSWKAATGNRFQLVTMWLDQSFEEKGAELQPGFKLLLACKWWQPFHLSHRVLPVWFHFELPPLVVFLSRPDPTPRSICVFVSVWIYLVNHPFSCVQTPVQLLRGVVGTSLMLKIQNHPGPGISCQCFLSLRPMNCLKWQFFFLIFL